MTAMQPSQKAQRTAPVEKNFRIDHVRSLFLAFCLMDPAEPAHLRELNPSRLKIRLMPLLVLPMVDHGPESGKSFMIFSSFGPQLAGRDAN